MYIDDHVRAKRPLGYWKELLQEWVFLVHRIYRISGKKTAVYAEKERANTGLVAAAATRNGWVALEECRTTKVDKYLKEYSYSGRCDLVLWRDRRHHEIEAKFCRIAKWNRSLKKIENAMERAVADSERSTASGYSSEKKVALVYIVPVIDLDSLANMESNDISEWLTSLVKEIRQTYKPTLMAYAFPGPVSLEGSEHRGLSAILIGQIIRK